MGWGGLVSLEPRALFPVFFFQILRDETFLKLSRLKRYQKCSSVKAAVAQDDIITSPIIASLNCNVITISEKLPMQTCN